MSPCIDPPTETARERAARIWHNNRIIRESQDHEPQPTDQQHNAPTLRREILKILSQRSNDTIRNYIISINERRRRLLKEKLRRLRAEQSSE
jgi:hypothetical protein